MLKQPQQRSDKALSKKIEFSTMKSKKPEEDNFASFGKRRTFGRTRKEFTEPNVSANFSCVGVQISDAEKAKTADNNIATIHEMTYNLVMKFVNILVACSLFLDCVSDASGAEKHSTVKTSHRNVSSRPNFSVNNALHTP